MTRPNKKKPVDLRGGLERSIRDAEDLEALKRALLGILDLVVSDVETNRDLIDSLDARISTLHPRS